MQLAQKFPGGEDVFTQVFRLEYSDRDNPVAFYPEYMAWFVFNGTLGATPQSGYWRNKLLDKIWVLSPEGKKNAVMTFTYDFSPEERPTAIYIAYHPIDANGNQLPELQHLNITEISY